jgi:thiamine pyrophosphokinase
MRNFSHIRENRDSSYTGVYRRFHSIENPAMNASPARGKRAFGVLGGVSLPISLLAKWAKSATFVAAADRGADALLAAGVTPNVVIGDLDSLHADRRIFPDVREDLSQNSTDCDKLLAALASEGWTSVTLANVTGGLPDHELAILHSAAKSGISCRLVYRLGLGYVLVGPVQGSVPALGRVSLLPLTPCAGVTIAGVRWALRDARLDPMGATSISNESISQNVGVEIESGAAFLFTEGANTPSWPE